MKRFDGCCSGYSDFLYDFSDFQGRAGGNGARSNAEFLNYRFSHKKIGACPRGLDNDRRSHVSFALPRRILHIEWRVLHGGAGCEALE
jgi:hypothetical protein